MKKIAIFVAGDIGKYVLNHLGEERVEFFFANEIREDNINGVPVISYADFLKKKNEVYIIVASTKYGEEMRCQLINDGINDFFVWDERVLELFDEGKLWTFPRYSPVYSGDDWSCRPYSLICSFLQYEYSSSGKILLYAYHETTDVLLGLLKMVGKYEDVIAVIHPQEVERHMFSHIIEHVNCVICAVRRDDNVLCDLYEQMADIQTIDLYDIAYFLPKYHCNEIKKYKDIYKGKRCFIIGNGPSLRAEDLEVLHKNNEITFASNKIYKIFGETNWRPDFYFCTDVWLFKSETRDILNVRPKDCSFYNYAFCNGTVLWLADEKILPIYNMTEQPDSVKKPRFSKDLSVYHTNGGGVAYTMLQAAYYMGFDEVYLLGMDHYTKSLMELRASEHFYESDKDLLWDLLPDIVKIDNHITLSNSYKKARIVFEEDGRKIYNATRGGYLEIFDRIDFDELYKR